MAAKEIVLALRLSEGTTREQFRALKGALIDVRDEIAQNNKALRDNAKEQRALDAAVKEGAVTTEQAAVRSQALLTARELLKNESANLASAEASLAAQYRESKNEVGGLTDAGLRFRDKMADATLAAINQSDVLNKLGTRMEFLRTEQDRLTKEFNDGKLTADQYKAAMDKLSTEEKDLAAQTTLLNGKVDLLTKEFKEGKISADQFRAGIKSIDQSVQGVGTAVSQGVSDLKSYALGFVGVVAVAQAAIGAIKAIAKTVSEFDQGLANIRALGEEFAGSIDQIGDAAIALGPKLGIAPVEALKGFEALAKAGLSTEQILSGGLESALTLAAAGTIEVGQAAEITAASLTQFNLQGEQAGLVADLLAKGANIAQGDVADFGAALNQTGLVANAFGLTIEETVGGLTAFAQAGLVGSDAGTSLKAALLRLQAPTEKSKELLDKYGITLTDANGEFISLSGVAGELQTKLGGLTQEQRSAALATIFGQDAIRVANILYEQGAEGVDKYTRSVNDSGFASRVAAEKLNSVSGVAAQTGAAFDALVLQIDDGSGKVSESLKNILSGFTAILEALGAGSELDKSIAAFTKRTQEEFNSLGGVGQLSNERGDAIVDGFRVATEAAKKYGTTVEDISLLESSRGAIIEKIRAIQEKFDKSRREGGEALNEEELVRLAAGQASIAAIGEEIAQRRRLQQSIKDGSETRAQATKRLNDELTVSKAVLDGLAVSNTEGIQKQKAIIAGIEQEIAAMGGQERALNSVASKRDGLTKSLEDAKAARDGLDASDAEGLKLADAGIAAIEKQIAALDGRGKAEGAATKKTQEQTQAEKDKIAVTQALTKAEEDRTRAQQIAAQVKVQQAADPTITEPQAQAQAAAIIDSTARIAAVQGDAELIKRIETQLQEDLAAIDAKFAADKVKNQDKANADLRTRNAALAQNELDALIERQNAELILAAKNGDDVNALAQSQAEARIALTQQIEDAAIAAKLETFDAEYAQAVTNGEDLLALTATQQEELAALKASFRDDDVAKQRAVDEYIIQGDEALASARIDIVAGFGQALQTLAKEGSDIAKAGLALQKAAAIAQIIVQTSAAVQAALAQATILAGPVAGPLIAAPAIAALKIGAGINIATIIAQAIAGFDQGGEVGSGNGTIKRSWGKPIRRKNGDNVLITAREGEKILNEDQQEELERLAGRDVWKRIGLPGAKYHGKTRDTFLQANGYATGGSVSNVSSMVNASAPVLTAIESVAEQRSFELNVVADIEEIVSVTNRRMAILETSRSR